MTFTQSHLIGGECGTRTYRFLTHCTVLIISKMQRKKIQVLFGLAGNRHIKKLKAEIKYLLNTSNWKWYFIYECFPNFDNYMIQSIDN